MAVGGSAIFLCTCKHEGQDKIHGKGRRVFNEGKGTYTCTVCGAQRSAPSRAKDK